MKIAFTGDLVLQELNKNPNFIFGQIVDFMSLNNIKLCINLESPFIQEEMTPVKNKITLYSEAGSVRYIEYLNPFLINLSNNHINDYGDISGRLTCEILESKSLTHFGIGYPEEEKNLFIDKKLKNIQISFTTRSSDLTGGPLFSGDNFIGPYSPDLSLISNLKNKYTDYSIIVSVHWGIEDITYPEPNKRSLAYDIIDAGADLIIGHHPHIIQPIEIYKGKTIFYSLGNFYFSDIHYFEKGKVKYKKSKRHQKTGLIPIIDITEGIVSIDTIMKVRILNNGQLKISKNLVRKFIISNSSIYKKIHVYYLKYFELRRIFLFILKNPDRLLKKIIK
jgi:hypothetical protein